MSWIFCARVAVGFRKQRNVIFSKLKYIIKFGCPRDLSLSAFCPISKSSKRMSLNRPSPEICDPGSLAQSLMLSK